MPSIVKLQNGESITTYEDSQALAERFDSSRRDGTLIKVDAEQGVVWVNLHVLATIAPQRKSVYEERGAPVLDLND